MAEKIRVAVRFGGYNTRRYSRPWIARIAKWTVGEKPELQFGQYVGDSDGGEVELLAFPGEVIRYGQKDLRGNGTQNAWGIANDDGTVRVVDASEARAHFGKGEK